MASKKKSGVKGAGVKSTAAQRKAKREELNKIHKAKTSGTGNSALDRANAVAKKGATRVTKAIKKAATGGAEVVKKAKPQFFGRPKAKKEIDPEKVKAERNAQHQRMMRVPWYAEHRAKSIELWVARRAAQAAGDAAEVEKINRKLDRINKERDKARAEWKAAGSVIPDVAPEKEEKPTRAKKSGGKKAAAKKSRKKKDQPPVDEQAATETIGEVLNDEPQADEPVETTTDEAANNVAE